MRVISGFLKGRGIKGINIEGTRPTMDRVKESLFAIIQNKINNSVCLDLFAGSGSLGIEAISNGCYKSYFVDDNKIAINIIKENIKNLDIIDKSIIINNDYMKSLINFKNNNIKFDIIFIDPPYKMHIINDIIEHISNNSLLNDNGIIVCETDDLYLNNKIGNIEKYKEKKYGSTYLTFYRINI